MIERGKFTATLLAMLAAVLLHAQPAPAASKVEDKDGTPLSERATLTDDWFGAGRLLAEHGLYVNLGLTHIYQRNLRDGLREDVGRHSGSYDLEVEADLERAAGIQATRLYVHAEGSWLGGEGLDSLAVGSLFGVNGDEAPDRSLDVTELWLERGFLQNRLVLRAGKLDMTGGFQCRGCPVTFDGNLFANDETGQFLNGALVNNPTIPFPDNGLAAIVYANPVPWWYIGAGIADAEADARETGFNTAFDGDEDYFSAVETGFVPEIRSAKGRLAGAYRIGVWHESGDQEHLDGAGSEPDDTGFYLSAGQMLWRETETDSQGLGVFCRAGWADGEVNEIDRFASAGLRYQGLIPGRGSDVLGLGLAWGGLSEEAGFGEPFERAIELYYNAEIAPWLHISPDLQFVSNPGGSGDGGDAVVAGVRVQMSI
jgi:porin